MTRHRRHRAANTSLLILVTAAATYGTAGTVLLGWRATVVAATGIVGILVITAATMWAIVAYLERRGDVMMVDQVLESIGTTGAEGVDHAELDALARVFDIADRRPGGAA